MATNEARVRAYLEPEEPNYKAAAADLGAEALPILEALVQGSDPLLASKAAYLASLIPGDEAARVLETASRSDHPTVRVAAAAGLQKRPDVSDDVASTLLSDPDEGVRKVATKATRSRTPTVGRDRPATRGSGRGAGGGAAQEGAGRPRLSEDEHGGGYSPDGDADADSASGEGGGDVGSARSDPSREARAGDGESGGGGDLTGTGGAQNGRSSDRPDGGGSPGSGAGKADTSGHGGGQT